MTKTLTKIKCNSNY